MQLKPGMKGIIIKGIECCGSMNFVGSLVEFVSYAPPYEYARCVHCNTFTKLTKEYVWVKKSGSAWCMLECRIKWFNDDIDLEDTTEEVTKELEDASV